MNSNLFGADDPWENGWSEESQKFGQSSTFLSSSQLLGQTNLGTDSPASWPSSYTDLFGHIAASLKTGSDLEALFLDKLVEDSYITRFQKSKILDLCYDNNLLPATLESNFCQIAGLIALEIDTPGSGDYVTLQFRKNNLPDLPTGLVNSFQKSDPLTEQLNEGEWENKQTWTDSNWSAQHQDSDWKEFRDGSDQQPLQGTVESNEPSQENSSWKADQDWQQSSLKPAKATPGDHREITKYINDTRDRFKPLVNSMDPIKIKEVPEKEGILFKHINYYITHDLKLGMNAHGGTKKVTRRYSDFVWLLEYLLQKYPFRVIPGLPPKKFSGEYFERDGEGEQHRKNIYDIYYMPYAT